MTSAWSSVRDELPQSVHDLMALWGGFDASVDGGDCGLGKRLELDFDCAFSVPAADVASAMASAGEELLLCRADAVLCTLTFSRSVVAVSARRVVAMSASSVALHSVLSPLLRLLSARGVGVEWASFMRMNSRSPWTATPEMSKVMAQEYVALKSAFPTGNSFLSGPVDREHFFHFVFDAIPRGGGGSRREEDVQINAFMFNVDGDAGAKRRQQITPHGDDGYEMLRVSTDDAAKPFAAFETNVFCAGRLRLLLAQFAPSRFTLVSLQDRHSTAAAHRSLLEETNGYAILSCTANHLAEGYVFHQTVFAREV